MMENKVIYGFDLLKFIMACLIVSIHTRAFNDTIYSEYFRIIQTWCVPTFFFLSSYFIMKKFVNPDNNRITVYTHFIKRLGILYALWFVINIPIYFSQHNFGEMSACGILIKIMKNILFASTFEGSWFLGALGLSVTLLLFFAYLGVNKWVIRKISDMVDRVANLDYRWAIPILLIVLMIVGAEVNNLVVEQIVTFFAVPFIVIYFYGLRLPNSDIWKYLRNCSILLYLLHFMIIVYFRHIPVLCELTGMTKYLTVLIISCVVSYIIIRLGKKPKTKMFQYLY